MDIWVIVEHRDGKVLPISWELFSAAKQIGHPVAVLLTDARGDMVEQLKVRGFDTVLVAEAAQLAHYSPKSYTSVLCQWAKEKQPAAILAGHTALGWDLIPKLALELEGGLATNVLELELDGEDLRFVRPIFGEKILSREKLTRKPWVLTIAPGAFPESPNGSAGAELKVEEFGGSVAESDWKFLGTEMASGEDVRLEEAEVVVSGGRGLKDKAKFEELILPLAELLGGAVGASRPVVDDGWLPKVHQVGSSGKVVKPKLYLAVGISGQTQHVAGMKNSQCIVAINKDPEAPIFDYAHYGVVGDLFEIVPKLLEKLREVKGNS